MRLREFVHPYYHGSDKAGLTELKPRHSDIVGHSVVFAAIYPEVAVSMSGHWNDDDFEFGRSMDRDADPDKVPYQMRELRDGAFDKFFSKPISLYQVDSKKFHDDPDIQDFEVISKHRVEVLNEERIDDPLDYLRKSKMVDLKFR
jgi:hypothetical protein